MEMINSIQVISSFSEGQDKEFTDKRINLIGDEGLMNGVKNDASIIRKFRILKEGTN